MLRQILIIGLVIAMDSSESLGDPPATQPTYRPGLAQEVYALPRRPKGFRAVLPGLPPKLARVTPTPEIRDRDDLDGQIGNVQAEYIGEINIPQAGEIGFAADADDGMEVSIDNRFVISDIWINGTRTPSRATVALQAGWRPIRVRFFQGDGGFRLRLRWKLPGESDFSDIPPTAFRVAESQVNESIAKLTPGDETDPSRTHRAAFRAQGFFELPEKEGDLLVELLEGPTLFSESARKDLAGTTKATNFAELPAWHQVKVLAGFLRGWYSESTKRGAVATRDAYTIAEPEPIEYNGWAGRKRQGFKHVVSIGDESYTIYTPAADSPERENVAGGIAGLPKSLRVMLRYVTVEPYGTANEFNGGGDNIWIRRQGPTPLGMIDDVFAHEIGHLLMNKTDCYLAWEAAIAKDLLSVSHYGRLNPSEDFGEFTRMILSTQGEEKQLSSMRVLFPARMAVMDDVLKKVEFRWIASPATAPSAQDTPPTPPRS